MKECKDQLTFFVGIFYLTILIYLKRSLKINSLSLWGILFDNINLVMKKFKDQHGYSKVPPLRACIIRNSGLILKNKIPLCKKLSRLIHAQFLIQWYIAIL